MKRGTPDHPKVAMFAELIKRRRPEALGYLELLFHFTAQYAPDGGIGRYDDKRIAAGIDWMGRPSQVIDALVAAGWLDRHPTARLVVHDWSDHADRATLARLSRAGKVMIKQNHKVAGNLCTQNVTTENTQCNDSVHLPEPEPKPEPKPEPEPRGVMTVAEFDGFDAGVIAREIWQRHPRHRKGTLIDAEVALTERLSSAVNQRELAEKINRNHAAWCKSEQWRSGKIMGLTRWLSSNDPGSCITDAPEQEEAKQSQRYLSVDEVLRARQQG